MELLIEEIIIYSLTGLLCLAVILLYLRKQRRTSAIVRAKIEKARAEGLYEPISLHPVVDPSSCIKTGACIIACPEKDILGIINGKATTINASQCVGHGACFQACPTHAISLCMGTEKRGVELPHVNQNFETNVPGIFIAGELGGMGLIKNAVEQGKQAVENCVRQLNRSHSAPYDLVIVGAGPAGISAALMAKKMGLKFLILEQDTLGGTVFTFPRAKVVMTSTMDLPLHGKIKLFETSKTQLLELWKSVLDKNGIVVREYSKVEEIKKDGQVFNVHVANGDHFVAAQVLLAIGRRGSPRKLGIPGENLEKVSYRLLEPEHISGEKIVVVGGGDSAIESALLLTDQNEVVLSYRGESFSRLKPKNTEKIQSAIQMGLIDLRLSSNLVRIDEKDVVIHSVRGEEILRNDRVYIFAGGELPTQFLMKAGIHITKKFGEAVLKHPGN